MISPYTFKSASGLYPCISITLTLLTEMYKKQCYCLECSFSYFFFFRKRLLHLHMNFIIYFLSYLTRSFVGIKLMSYLLHTNLKLLYLFCEVIL